MTPSTVQRHPSSAALIVQPAQRIRRSRKTLPVCAPNIGAHARTRSMRSLSHRGGSFTAETHLADALNAMFFTAPVYEPRSRRSSYRWDGLLKTMPVLAPMVTSFPQSGYLAVVFLTLMENSLRRVFAIHGRGGVGMAKNPFRRR